MTKFLFFCDIDGTLLCKERDIDEQTIQLINDLETLKCRVILCTGRSIHSTGRIATKLNADNPCILYNGAVIHNFKASETTKVAFLDEAIRSKVDAVYKLFPSIGIMAYTLTGNYMIRSTPFLRTRGLQLEMVPHETRLERVTERIIKIVLASSNREDLIACQPLFCEYQFMFGSRHFVEIVAAGVSKGSAAKEMQNFYGIGREHTFCAGDAENDLSLFEVSHMGFAPENAMESIKRAATDLVPNCTEGGVKVAFQNASKRILAPNNLVNQGDNK